MNPALTEIIAASEDERRNLFAATALRLGTTIQNIEKDFWVCWALDALFNGLAPGGPRLLFKGGTSLSKGYGLIRRFSEDVDVTVFRADLGEPVLVDELMTLTGKKRSGRLDAIKSACQKYIQGSLKAELAEIATQTMREARIGDNRIRIESDGNVARRSPPPKMTFP